MLPPKSWRLPEYHTSMTLPLRLIVFSRHRSVLTIFPSRDDVRTSLLLGTSQGVGQLRRLDSQHRHRLVSVPVSRGPADPEPRGQHGEVLSLAEPDQREQRLLAAAQCSAAPSGTASAAPGGQQRSDIGDQFPGYVERGTIGNHVEFFG